uniref:Endonuclease/exonuclease/phosphatase domain-containing protein n=1 Tax=Arcella intermedia TaxID=1963864 RepID=A0A6B2LFQ4_9EUKA
MLTQNMNIHHFVYHSYANRESRIKGLLAVLEDFDIVALQEVFVFNTPLMGNVGTFGRQSILDHWKHHYAVPPSPPLLQQDSGLMILSKYPILQTWSLSFDHRGPTEYLSQKGALMAKIEVGDKKVNVITTHLDARSAAVRALQVDQIVDQFLHKTLGLGDGETEEGCILVGDLNSNPMKSGYSAAISYFADSQDEFVKVSQKLDPLKEVRSQGGIPYERTMAFNVCLALHTMSM